MSNINKRIENAIINYENNKYLCLCVPGSHLKNCYLLSLYPVSNIESIIEKFRSDIYMLIIILLFVVVLTGSLLAQNFIVPIKELNRGLSALRKRDTDIKISIDNKDELGNLGSTFNQMMEEIKDLLLAGAVQKCLIPSGEHKIDGYECVVYNEMADDVGGDYADIFELQEDRLLIVIGDVTGHGISSSLLTVMVKASIFRFVKEETSLKDIVTNTSRMISDLLNKKKTMTFCAITLDKKTGEMFICNAGHPFPIIREKEIGHFRILSNSSLPMGASKKRCNYSVESETISHEETLVIYTDGFPEAENSEGKEYGYENFKNLIANIPIKNAEDLKNQLVDIFKKYHGNTELSDDVTFIILRRKPLQNH